MAEKDTSGKGVSFKDTLNLPHTDFPMKAASKISDPSMIERWQKENLFAASSLHNEGNEKFIFHDGPPYANGNIHLGHAYNKILKDIVSKSQRMQGKHVPVKPGWDCHGLPIEIKVTQENPGLDPAALKKSCRAYALKWVEIQKAEFKKLGILMDWENPYLTMSFDYEASILRAFGNFVADGYIERKNKTVPWCSSCQTVLATAEIEYQDRKDPSLYVLFSLRPDTVNALFPELHDKQVNLLIWTTTPWTLPLNRAVILRPNTPYVVLDVNGTYIVTAQKLADKVAGLVEAETKIIAECSSQTFKDVAARAQHPFVQELVVPVLLDDSVSLDDGTACVHSAPGCGPEDYEIGIRNGLEIYSPLTVDGNYSEDIVPKELHSMPVTDGQIWVIKKLAHSGRLFFKQSLTHSYPHCWRCHKGLIFRATKQWFCDLSKGGLKERAIEAVDTINMLPKKSSNSFKATLGGRLEWCLSRQRIWGVPIPGFMCVQCDYTYVTQGLVEKVAQQVEKQGIEYWDNVQPHDLMPQGFACPMCKGTQFKKEQDILDVWFDSGISHFAVLKNNIGFPASMYLEGKDQYRGWFQSSLLTAMVLEGKPPMKNILTHGYTVDEKGRKMSKSLGNVVSPDDIVDQLGTDGLRLWAATIDYADEVVVSKVLLQNVQEVYRKIRNTCRFLLSNLYDFDKDTDAIPLERLRVIDRYALNNLAQMHEAIVKDYQAFNFTAIFHRLADYCTVDLSAFYLDITKDCLYVAQADGLDRRSAQTAYWYILDTITKVMAPILSFTAELISDHYQKDKKTSIHLQKFAEVKSMKMTRDYEQQWDILKTIRSDVLKSLEGLREKGVIKHSLEAQVILYMEEATLEQSLDPLIKEIEATGQTVEAFFKEFFIVSQVVIASSSTGLENRTCEGLFIHTQRVQGSKCPRCWHWENTTHEHGLCMRCQSIVEKS